MANSSLWPKNRVSFPQGSEMGNRDSSQWDLLCSNPSPHLWLVCFPACIKKTNKHRFFLSPKFLSSFMWILPGAHTMFCIYVNPHKIVFSLKVVRILLPLCITIIVFYLVNSISQQKWSLFDLYSFNSCVFVFLPPLWSIDQLGVPCVSFNYLLSLVVMKYTLRNKSLFCWQYIWLPGGPVCTVRAERTTEPPPGGRRLKVAAAVHQLFWVSEIICFLKFLYTIYYWIALYSICLFSSYKNKNLKVWLYQNS